MTVENNEQKSLLASCKGIDTFILLISRICIYSNRVLTH